MIAVYSGEVDAQCGAKMVPCVDAKRLLVQALHEEQYNILLSRHRFG